MFFFATLKCFFFFFGGVRRLEGLYPRDDRRCKVTEGSLARNFLCFLH